MLTPVSPQLAPGAFCPSPHAQIARPAGSAGRPSQPKLGPEPSKVLNSKAKISHSGSEPESRQVQPRV